MRWRKKSSLSVFSRRLHPGKVKKQRLKRLLKSTWDEKWEMRTLQKQIVLSESKPSKWSSSSDNKRRGGKQVPDQLHDWPPCEARLLCHPSTFQLAWPPICADQLTQPVQAHVALGAQDAIRTCGSWRSAAECPHWVKVRGWAHSAGWGTAGTQRIRKVKSQLLFKSLILFYST